MQYLKIKFYLKIKLESTYIYLNIHVGEFMYVVLKPAIMDNQESRQQNIGKNILFDGVAATSDNGCPIPTKRGIVQEGNSTTLSTVYFLQK